MRLLCQSGPSSSFSFSCEVILACLLFCGPLFCRESSDIQIQNMHMERQVREDQDLNRFRAKLRSLSALAVRVVIFARGTFPSDSMYQQRNMEGLTATRCGAAGTRKPCSRGSQCSNPALPDASFRTEDVQNEDGCTPVFQSNNRSNVLGHLPHAAPNLWDRFSALVHVVKFNHSGPMFLRGESCGLIFSVDY